MYTVIARIIIKRIAKKVYSENESIKTLNQSERNGVRRKKETQNTWNKQEYYRKAKLIGDYISYK